MKRELKKAIEEMLKFNGLDKNLYNIEHNVGTIWFEYDGHTYFIQVAECESSLE